MLLNDDKLRVLITAYDIELSLGHDTVVSKYSERDNYVRDYLLNDLHLLAIDDTTYAENVYHYIGLADKNILRTSGGKDGILKNIEAIRVGLRHAKYGTDEPIQRAHNLIYGHQSIKGYGIAFWSPIMQVVADLPNWNDVTTQFMKLAGSPVRNSEMTFVTDYKKIFDTTNKLKQISKNNDPNYINHFMKFCISDKPQVAKAILG